MNIIYLILILPFIVMGCQKLDDVAVKMEDNQLIFYDDEIQEECTKGVFIYDFGVQQLLGEKSRAAWALVRSERWIEGVSEVSFDLPMVYGLNHHKINVVTPAVELISGKYNFAGTLLCITESQEKSISINGYFIIDKDGLLLNK